MSEHVTENIDADLREFYRRFYGEGKSNHSPEQLRRSAESQIIEYLKTCGKKDVSMIDIGSGPQALLKALYNDITEINPKPNSPKTQPRNQAVPTESIYVTSLDAAPIHAPLLRLSRLKALRTPFKSVKHIQSDAAQIKAPDASFDLVVSTLAIDFAHEHAFDEAYRILKPGGKAIIFLNHPDSFAHPGRAKHASVKEFLELIQNGDILFRDKNNILQRMRKAGFKLEESDIRLRSEGDWSWWEIAAGKD